jgi:hypothetical protein
MPEKEVEPLLATKDVNGDTKKANGVTHDC